MKLVERSSDPWTKTTGRPSVAVLGDSSSSRSMCRGAPRCGGQPEPWVQLATIGHGSREDELPDCRARRPLGSMRCLNNRRTSSVGEPTPGGAFGPNAWLVDDMYDQFRRDPAVGERELARVLRDYVAGRPRRARRVGLRSKLDGASLKRSTGSDSTEPPANGSTPPPSYGHSSNRHRSRRLAARIFQCAGHDARSDPAGDAGTARRPVLVGPTAPPHVEAPESEGRFSPERRSRIAANMEASLVGADRDERPDGGGEAPPGQPDPAQPALDAYLRDEGELHPPHRLRGGPGPCRATEPQLRLRRRRRRKGPSRGDPSRARRARSRGRRIASPTGPEHFSFR